MQFIPNLEKVRLTNLGCTISSMIFADPSFAFSQCETIILIIPLYLNIILKNFSIGQQSYMEIQCCAVLHRKASKCENGRSPTNGGFRSPFEGIRNNRKRNFSVGPPASFFSAAD